MGHPGHEPGDPQGIWSHSHMASVSMPRVWCGLLTPAPRQEELVYELPITVCRPQPSLCFLRAVGVFLRMENPAVALTMWNPSGEALGCSSLGGSKRERGRDHASV